MFVQSDLADAIPPKSTTAGAAAPQRRRRDERVADWDRLAEPLQLTLAAAALRRAAATIAFQAETLAREMEAGCIDDLGGADALRLFSAIVRVSTEPGLGSL